MNMQLRFSLGMMPLKYRMQIQYVPALPCISPAEPIPGELLLSRAHFRFDSNTKFKRKNYIYKLSKKATTYSAAFQILIFSDLAMVKKLTYKYKAK